MPASGSPWDYANNGSDPARRLHDRHGGDGYRFGHRLRCRVLGTERRWPETLVAMSGLSGVTAIAGRQHCPPQDACNVVGQ